MRINLSLLSICIVDSWMLYGGAQGVAADLSQAQFYEDLAEQLIDNTYDSVGSGRSGPPVARAAEAAPVQSGVGIHLTPTLKRRHKASAEDVDQCAQRMCRVCKKYRTTVVCSRCREVHASEVFCCGARSGRNCFAVHMREVHDLDV